MRIAGNRIAALALAVMVFVAAFVACSGSDAPTVGPSGVTADAGTTRTIGATGGTVAAGAVELQVPPGALATATAITVAESTAPAPAGVAAVTPLSTFGPDGLVFATPVTVRIAYSSAHVGLRIFWSRQNDPTSYEPLATQLDGGFATAQVTHFSNGFVGYEVDTDADAQADAQADTGSPNLPSAVAPVSFDVPGGSFSSAISVSLETETAGATIHYTVDGSEPVATSTVYVAGTGIAIAATTTVKAFATKEGLLDSAVTAATYTITPPTRTVAPVTFAPGEGTYTTTQSVSLSTATQGATIFFTVDGSNPTTNSVVYASPIAISATTTIRAFATRSGYASAAITQAVVTISKPAQNVGPVGFTPGPGVYNNPLSVDLSSTTSGATIFYTVDGTTPTQASAVYNAGSPIPLDAATTVKAFATHAGDNDSSVTSASYSFQAAKVQFSPSSGTVPVNVVLATATVPAAGGAPHIYYTADGSTPTTASTLYTGPIHLVTATTIRALATRSGYADATIATASYTAP